MSEAHRYKVVKMLTEHGNRLSYDPHGPEVVMAQAYDELRAEVAGLRTGYEAYERVNAELKAEVEKLRTALTYIRDTSDDWHVCEKAADALADAATASEAECAARKIYESWAGQDGFVPWVAGGNSLKQDEARRLARAAMGQGEQS